MKSEINLLSPAAKANRFKTIRNRRINAISDALLVCLLFIVASYGAAYWVLSEVSASLYERENTHEEEYVKMEREFRAANALLLTVRERVSRQQLITPLLPDILRTVPAGILLTKLQLSEAPRTLSVTGKASQGSAVVQYQRALEQLSWVDQVVAPIQNFAVSPDATALFTIIPKEEKEGTL